MRYSKKEIENLRDFYKDQFADLRLSLHEFSRQRIWRVVWILTSRWNSGATHEREFI